MRRPHPALSATFPVRGEGHGQPREAAPTEDGERGRGKPLPYGREGGKGGGLWHKTVDFSNGIGYNIISLYRRRKR